MMRMLIAHARRYAVYALRIAVAFAALLGAGAGALAMDAKPQIVLLHPDAHPPDSEAMVLPAGSPMRLVSFPRDFYSSAAFRGQFTLSGKYEIGADADNTVATVWPDQPSRKLLPYWRLHGGPSEIDVSNAEAFAKAVIPRDMLQKLKAGKLPSVRGRVTIVADDYKSSIECDVANFSARFISVVKPPMRMAAKPTSEEGC
ncbi:MAG: hypothetical protein ACJ8EL_16300 [Rhizomicrobium sp.]|jgi:hypothetical protein